MPLRVLLWTSVLISGLWLLPDARAQQGGGHRAATFSLPPNVDWESEAATFLEGLRQRPLATDAAWRSRLLALAVVLPGPLAEAVQAGDASGVEAWWTRRDPRPSTSVNEGLVEHLKREVIARELFSADTPTGLDARGEVFVRFGAPRRSRVIDVSEDLFIARGIRDDPALRLSDFPRNEAWYYPSLAQGAYFLFVQQRGVYREGTPMELLPRSLRTGGLNRATVSRAQLLGQSIRWIYKDLFEFSPEVRRRMTVLDSRIGGDGAAFSGNTGFVLSDEVQRARREDGDATARRDRALPPRTTSLATDPRSGVEWRLARFLSRAGVPEIAVVWRATPAPERAVPDASGAVFDIAAVRYGRGLSRQAVDRARVVEREAPRAPYDLTIQAPEAETVAVEWNRRVLVGDNGMLAEPVDVDVAWADSLAHIFPEDAEIGLSDVLLIDPTMGADIQTREDALPLAVTDIARSSGEPIGFYFETYRRDAEEPLTTTVEVLVSERTEGGLFRRAQTTGAAISFTDQMDGQMAPRVVDLGRAPEADELLIEVVVTVAETGARATRELRVPLTR